MKLSIYTFVKDGLYYDFHVVDMLKHHLPLADEIIVNEGYSTDGTYEAIRNLDPKIKIQRRHWDRSQPGAWHVRFKDEARRACTGDWCILLDCDEFIPEWEFERLRAYLAQTDESILRTRYVNFYGNYRVYLASPEKFNWPVYKHVIHRNRTDIEVWGDGSNVAITGQPNQHTGEMFDCHHYGAVRNPARLRQKWRTLYNQYHAGKPRWSRMPGFLFDLFPHRWNDPYFVGDLKVYEGTPVQAVRENPDEFVRDRFQMYKLLAEQQPARS